MAHPSRKVTNSSSGGGGEKNPPPGKIESSHKLPLRKKRKNIMQEEEDQHIESDINSFSLEDMELEAGYRENVSHIGSAREHDPPESIIGNH
jgi:hypothetical protein